MFSLLYVGSIIRVCGSKDMRELRLESKLMQLCRVDMAEI